MFCSQGPLEWWSCLLEPLWQWGLALLVMGCSLVQEVFVGGIVVPCLLNPRRRPYLLKLRRTWPSLEACVLWACGGIGSLADP